MFTKLKQFKDLRDKAKTIQSELAKESVEGSAAWGKLTITMNGNQQVTNVSIDPSLLTDANALGNHIKDAVNDAVHKVQKTMAGKLKDLGGDDLAKEMKDMMGQ